MSRGNPDTFVVVPMYNESGSIESVVRDLGSSFRNIVCVDDGSSDDTAQRVSALERVHLVRHPSNLGQGAALQTGIEFALADPRIAYVVTFDADGQHRVVDASAMVRMARSTGLSVVLGSRFLGAGDAAGVPRIRRIVLRAAVTFTRLTTGLDVTDTHNGLRVLARPAAESLSITLPGMAHASEVLGQIARQKLPYAEHPVSIAYTEYSRSKGQSSINAVNILFDLVGHRLRGDLRLGPL